MADDIAALCEKATRAIDYQDDPRGAQLLRRLVEVLERVTTERDALVDDHDQLRIGLVEANERADALYGRAEKWKVATTQVALDRDDARAERDAARLEAEQASDRATGYARELYQLRAALAALHLLATELVRELRIKCEASIHEQQERELAEIAESRNLTEPAS